MTKGMVGKITLRERKNQIQEMLRRQRVAKKKPAKCPEGYQVEVLPHGSVCIKKVH